MATHVVDQLLHGTDEDVSCFLNDQGVTMEPVPRPRAGETSSSQ